MKNTSSKLKVEHLGEDQPKAGVASVNITPPLGLDVAGYGFGKSRRILDDLYAQVLCLETDSKASTRLCIRFLLIVCESSGEEAHRSPRKTPGIAIALLLRAHSRVEL